MQRYGMKSLTSRKSTRRNERARTAALPWYATLEVTPMIMPRNRKFPDPSVRAGLVARIRREIEKGEYDTPEKLELALQRMFESLAEQNDEEDGD